MADFEIFAEPREVTGKKVKRLRKQGLVPITVYGNKIDAMTLQTDYRSLELALRKAGGTNIIDMNSEGKTVQVVARDVQRDVVRGDIIHADFYAIEAGTKIPAVIPIQLLGESPAVENGKGILMTGLNSLNVEILPSELIDTIDVDLSGLEEINDAIHVSDLNLSESITILDEPEEMIARVSQTSAARAELLEEVYAEEEAAAGDVEVEGERSEEEEEGEEE